MMYGDNSSPATMEETFGNEIKNQKVDEEIIMTFNTHHQKKVTIADRVRFSLASLRNVFRNYMQKSFNIFHIFLIVLFFSVALLISFLSQTQDSSGMQNVNFNIQAGSNVNFTYSSSSKHYDPCDPKNFLVLIKASSSSDYKDRRNTWRKSRCRHILNSYGVQYKFMMGVPAISKVNPSSHDQFKRATKREIKEFHAILDEKKLNNDIVILPLKDVYEDFHLKTFNILSWAATTGMNQQTSFAVLQDDEYCFQPSKLQLICEEWKKEKGKAQVYAGTYYWREAASPAQIGDDNSFAPYHAGHMYILSSELIRYIVSDDDWILASDHINNSEDLQVGRWVKNQSEKHNFKLFVAEDRSLHWPVELDDPAEFTTDNNEVVKGDYFFTRTVICSGLKTAPACHLCSPDLGKEFCSSEECVWSDAENKCINK